VPVELIIMNYVLITTSSSSSSSTTTATATSTIIAKANGFNVQFLGIVEGNFKLNQNILFACWLSKRLILSKTV